MTELTAFILGYLAKALVGVLMGKLVMYSYNHLRDWPRVLHYLHSHDAKRSWNCIDCKLGNPTKVDSIS